MKKFAPIILFLIIVLLPSSPRIYNYVISRIDELDAEGTIAFYLNVPVKEAEVVPHEDKVECKCNGTGKVRGPDGILMIPCPCLNESNKCECQSVKKGTALPSEVKETTMKPKKQIYMLTSSSCINCVKFDKDFGDSLKKDGFGYETATVDIGQAGEDKSENVIFRKISKEKTPKLFAKYNQAGFFEYVPQFILVEDGVPIKYYRGYTSKETVLGLLK